MTAKFRNVKPLWLHEYDDLPHAEICDGSDGEQIFVNMENWGWSVDEARALHKWLSKALPKERKK